MPIAPEPITSSDFGIFAGTIASKYDQISLPSTSMPGICRGRAPVAKMMCGACSSAFGLPSGPLTARCPPPVSLPKPSTTVTLFFFNRCAMPEDSCLETPRERFTILSRSN